MSLSVGIVGLPNVGKSTLFNALLKRQVALAANYPFATIDPNTGIVPVPDPRLEVLAKVIAKQRDPIASLQDDKLPPLKPATVEFLDIAGLVKGASEGAGLGNKFLSHIRETDLICQVVRGFSDPDVIREGSTDPKNDREVIETELLLADIATLEKQKEPKASQDKELREKWDIIEEMKRMANEGKMIRQMFPVETQSSASLHDTDLIDTVAKELGLLTAKPIIYVVNVDEGETKNFASLQERYAQEFNVKPEAIVIISAKIESELSSLSDEDQKLFLSELGLEQSGLERLIQKAYQLLGLQSFLTAGELEVRAWTIHKGTKAPQAAAVIHTDFEKHFIKANIASFEDFVKYEGWKGVKDVGKMRMEGKEYVMQEGDVVEFMIGK